MIFLRLAFLLALRAVSIWPDGVQVGKVDEIPLAVAHAGKATQHAKSAALMKDLLFHQAIAKSGKFLGKFLALQSAMQAPVFCRPLKVRGWCQIAISEGWYTSNGERDVLHLIEAISMELGVKFSE